MKKKTINVTLDSDHSAAPPKAKHHPEDFELLRNLIMDAPDIIFSTDANGIFLFINRVRPGFVREEVIGSSMFDYLDEENAKLLREGLVEASTKRKECTYEVKGPGAYKSVAWYRTRIKPVFKDGQLHGYNFITSDVTAEKQLREAHARASLTQSINTKLKAEIQRRIKFERELKVSETKFRQLVEHASDAVFICEPNGDAAYVSPAYDRIWQRSSDNLKDEPRKWMEAIHPEDLPQFNRIFESLSRNGKAVNDFQFRMVLPDKRIKNIWAHLMPVKNERGRVYRIVWVATDLSPQVPVENTTSSSSNADIRKNGSNKRAA